MVAVGELSEDEVVYGDDGACVFEGADVEWEFVAESVVEVDVVVFEVGGYGVCSPDVFEWSVPDAFWVSDLDVWECGEVVEAVCFVG